MGEAAVLTLRVTSWKREHREICLAKGGGIYHSLNNHFKTPLEQLQLTAVYVSVSPTGRKQKKKQLVIIKVHFPSSFHSFKNPSILPVLPLDDRMAATAKLHRTWDRAISPLPPSP